jgi:hypothetical protein
MLVTVMALVACAGRRDPAPSPFDPGLIVTAGVLQRWNEDKARLGPTFAGSAAWQAHLDFVERELRGRGVEDIGRLGVPYRRWHTADDPAENQWSLAVDGVAVPVASYWAYSGSTPESGVTAPLVYYDPSSPPDVTGRIVVFDVPALPDPLPPVLRAPAREFATPDLGTPGIATEQWYQSNYPTRFGRYGEILKKGQAAGGLVIFGMNPGRARGLYTFPLLAAEPVGVPALYLDRVAGAGVRAAARDVRPATLRLLARTEPAEPYFLSGILPGRDYGKTDDEFVLLVTHTDGPNLTQENGALAILAVIDYFAMMPAIERRRSLLVVLDPQHYMPGRHLVDWYTQHPELAARIVASVGIEQLGQREYAEQGDGFAPTGRPEATLLFAQDNPRLVAMAIAAVTSAGLPRTEVRVPARGQGQWMGLGDIALKRNIPGFGTSTDMSAYWSTAPGIESFDSELARRQVAMLAWLTAGLMTAELDDIAVPAKSR